MKFFTCVLDPVGRGVPEGVRRAYEAFPRSRQLSFQWTSPNGIATLTGWDHPHDEPLVATYEGWIAVGLARLDNRDDVTRQTGDGSAALTDLALILRIVARYGAHSIPRLLGDFGLVVWNADTRSGMAFCDAFAVQKMYYAERKGLVAFSSRAEALALEEQYDVRYLATLVSLHDRPRNLSVYAGVRAVPPASSVTIQHGHLDIQQYWHASEFQLEPSWKESEREVVATCRELLTESIRQRVSGDGRTWAQLSGGIDSSSVVSLTQWLAERGEIPQGLAGTVTFVDRRGTGTDEREYSDAVVERWGLLNETIVEPPMWYDEEYPPPRTDQPRGDTHIYPRDNRLRTIVRSAGGRVLLTGMGGDELFTGNMLFFADWLAAGRVGPTLREMARRAAIGRVSFWELAYRNAVLPLLPRAVHARLVHDQHEIPTLSWLERAALEQYGLVARPSSASKYGGRLGQHYQHAVTASIAGLECPHHGGLVADSLDIRHPLLYRPLVEFALRLPPELRARPHAHRWVVREALKGILPEKVRTRVGKPGTADVLAWSLATQRSQLMSLTRDPILADLGIVNAHRLRVAFDAASQHAPAAGEIYAPLFATLGVEAWLQIRSGRWPCNGN